MDDPVSTFFHEGRGGYPEGHFHRVVAMHKSPDIDFSQLRALAPTIPRGWYELSHLPVEDRIEFTKEFWFSQLPFDPQATPYFSEFFRRLSDIGVYLTQKTKEEPFVAELVYVLQNGEGFFRGGPPCDEERLIQAQSHFSDFIFPEDYVAFLQIHNGFRKATDTGILPVEELIATYEKLQQLVEEGEEPLTSPSGGVVDPKTLIPFYESFGFPCFQCFWSEWYPSDEMGNVYYSGLACSVSDHTQDISSPENQAFPTFLDFLRFYLEELA